MRPALPPRQKRTRRKELTFSPTEWAVIEQRARECGVRPNCYIRDVVLGAVPRARPNGATRDLVAAVNRIGNNLNQLARVANENGTGSASPASSTTSTPSSTSRPRPPRSWRRAWRS